MPASQNLENPSPISETGKDPIQDAEFNTRIRALIAEAACSDDPSNNATMQGIREVYTKKQYDVSPALDKYLSFLHSTYPDSTAAVISPNQKFNALSVDQLVYFGLFLASERELKFI